MPGSPRVYINNGCYHIIARGNQKQQIFKQDGDYLKYLVLLKKYKKIYSFKMYGYCLMLNHIHILGQVANAPNLSKFIQVVNRTYTAHFNNSYNKVGHLWQGRFKSKIIVKDQYLINCVNYIECNSVRANLVSNPDEYMWSSYRERNMFKCNFNLLDPLIL
ncbi:MAG: transposase [Candidatus Omnitrophota bacterium]|jgi:putative transposase